MKLVFLVDDDPAVTRLLGRVLREEGWEVETFDSAEAFLARSKPERYGCLVLDVSMPGLDGLKLQRRLRETGQSLPIVFLTGDGDIRMSVQAIKAGAADFLTKPVTSDALAHAVRTAFDKDAADRVARAERAMLEWHLATLTAREHECSWPAQGKTQQADRRRPRHRRADRQVPSRAHHGTHASAHDRRADELRCDSRHSLTGALAGADGVANRQRGALATISVRPETALRSVMTDVISWLEAIVRASPMPLLEVWGRFSYVVGLLLAICAFGGFTFRIGDRWGFGRARQTWNTKAFLSMPLTAVLVIATGYLGSFIVLVQGAQTFESLKDLVVLLCIVLFGYPALIAVPPAYMLSDLIEGVPPGFVLNWAEGYFFWAAFVWMAYQLIGRNPDFRRLRTWGRYAVFVALIMLFDPVMWGFICSGKFTSAISYGNILPALFFTLAITWLLGPVAFLVALPLARRFGWFWAEIPGHVRERAIGDSEWRWEAGRGTTPGDAVPVQEGLPVRVFIFTPFIALALVLVGATAIIALRSAENDAARLATRLHQGGRKTSACSWTTTWRRRRRRRMPSAPPASSSCCGGRPSARMVEPSSSTERAR